MSLPKFTLAVIIGIALGWLLPNVFEDKRVWCLPYEISLEKQSERSIEITEVGKLFSPEPGIEHAFWCYQKK
jgi:hypothetical protein